MRVSQFNERITFEEPSSSIDSSGGEVDSWSEIETDPTMWAKVQPSAGSEGFEGDIKTSKKSYSFMIRHRNDITTKQRIVWKNKKWDITSVDPFFKMGRNEYVLVEAEYQGERYE